VIHKLFNRFFDEWLYTFPSFCVHVVIFVVWMVTVEVYPWSYLLIGVSLYSILITLGIGISQRHHAEQLHEGQRQIKSKLDE